MSAEITYAPAANERAGSLAAWFFIYAAIFVIPVALFFLAMCYWIPVFQEIFKDFKATLPTMTSWLLWTSYYVRSPLIGIPLFLFFLALPLLLANSTSKIKSSTRRVTSTLIVILVVMFVSFTTFLLIETALFLPLVALVRSVSGGAPGP